MGTFLRGCKVRWDQGWAAELMGRGPDFSRSSGTRGAASVGAHQEFLEKPASPLVLQDRLLVTWRAKGGMLPRATLQAIEVSSRNRNGAPPCASTGCREHSCAHKAALPLLPWGSLIRLGEKGWR